MTPRTVVMVHLLQEKGRFLCIPADLFAARSEEKVVFRDNGAFKAS